MAPGPDLGSRGQILAPEAESWLQRLNLGSRGWLLAPEAGYWLRRLVIGSGSWVFALEASLSHKRPDYDS